MIIADTSVWIDYLKGHEEITAMMRPYISKHQVVAISAVFGELLQGVKNKRERSIIEGFWEHLPKVDEQDLFINAGQISNEHKLYTNGVGLIDCYLLAAAVKFDLALWTKDKKLLKAVDIVSD